MKPIKTKIWAHRGASQEAPENTLLAFKKAIEMGADGIELDVQMTKDGELVVIHDETIDRTSDGTGYVKDYTLKQLQCYNFGKGYAKVATIPTLRQVYELMQSNDLMLNIELKNGIIHYEGMEQKVLELAKEMKMESRLIYSSFNHQSLVYLKQLQKNIKTGVLYADGWLQVADYAVHIGASALHPAVYLINQSLIQNAKKRGLKVHVWTVNEAEDMKRLVQLGVDAIITNTPDLARKVIGVS